MQQCALPSVGRKAFCTATWWNWLGNRQPDHSRFGLRLRNRQQDNKLRWTKSCPHDEGLPRGVGFSASVSPFQPAASIRCSPSVSRTYVLPAFFSSDLRISESSEISFSRLSFNSPRTFHRVQYIAKSTISKKLSKLTAKFVIVTSPNKKQVIYRWHS